MGDFHQEGIITTLHSLYEAFERNTYLESLEKKLEQYARHSKISLLLPSLYAEIENPEVLDRILNEIQQVRYLHNVVVALGGAPEKSQFPFLRYRLAPYYALPCSLEYRNSPYRSGTWLL